MKIKQLDKLIGKAVCIFIFLLSVTYMSITITGMAGIQNKQQQQIEDLSKKIDNMELLYQNCNKNVSRGTERQITLSQSERKYIERVCMAEAGNDIQGLLAVAQVIHNRSVLWNKTPYEVVTQNNQFAKPAKGEISAEAVQAVCAVFDENMKAFEDNNVTHFYAENSQEPYWTDGKEYVGSRGGNLFFY